MTHDAAFQPVDITRRSGDDGRPVVDSFRHSIAAYRLAELLSFIMRKVGAATETGDDAPFNGLIFVENWFQELTERVPVP